jgi:hypothetical protein
MFRRNVQFKSKKKSRSKERLQYLSTSWDGVSIFEFPSDFFLIMHNHDFLSHHPGSSFELKDIQTCVEVFGIDEFGLFTF